MADSTRIEGNRVYCHLCNHEWERSRGGLQCPECGSEFVEIVEQNTRPDIDTVYTQNNQRSLPTSPRPAQPETNPLRDHNPWAPDPDDDDITTFEFNTGGGRGTVSFTSRTYTYGGNGRNDAASVEVRRNVETMLGSIVGMPNARYPTPMMGGGVFQFPTQQQPRGNTGFQSGPQDLISLLFRNTAGSNPRSNQPSSPFDFLSAILNSGNAQHGDMVFSQEAFDRIMTQLMEQNQSTGAPGPASETAINSLKQIPVDSSMMGSDGKAECSICMDNVHIGEKVTVLPCSHWFHHECIVSWLKEHDTCPHCRQPVGDPSESTQPTPSSRLSRQSTAASSAYQDNARRVPSTGSSHSMHEVTERQHATRSNSSGGRSVHESRPSISRDRRSDSGNGSVGDWLRRNNPFS